jgi:cell division initiation protein
MFTPQQIDQISFGTVAFGGYDKQAVDEFLEPLTEDYVTLYKDNGLLKSKMKVLVSKLEEYRKN